jgi:hypothetical protein
MRMTDGNACPDRSYDQVPLDPSESVRKPPFLTRKNEVLTGKSLFPTGKAKCSRGMLLRSTYSIRAEETLLLAK